MMTRADRPAGGDALPEGFRVRPAGLEDATAVTALVAASQEELHGEAEVTRASMLAKWQAPRFDLGRDAWLIETATGVPAAAGPAKAPLVVAFGAVRGSAPGEFAGNLAVHPRFNGRGLGPYLLARIERRVRAAAKRSGAHSAVLHTWSSSADAPLVELYLGAGFERVAVFSRMEKDLETGLQDPAWPSGIESRAFRRGKDELTVYTALAEAFGEDDDDLPDAEEWARNVVERPARRTRPVAARLGGRCRRRGGRLLVRGRKGDRGASRRASGVARPWHRRRTAARRLPGVVPPRRDRGRPRRAARRRRRGARSVPRARA